MNKRRHAKSFPLAATIIIIAVAICGVTFAIKALSVKYQVIQGGNKLKQIERELAELNVKNEALQTRKDLLTSPPRLQEAINKGILGLMKIDEKFVVNVGRPVKADVAASISTSREDGR